MTKEREIIGTEVGMPRKRINSKAKGNEYELKIAKVLSEWWGEKFHRVPMSGGLQWGADSRVVGDIVTKPDSLWPFSVECKKREGWDFEQILKGTGDVEKWWSQAVRDAAKLNILPMLIFSKNRAPDYVMIQHEVFGKLLYKLLCKHIDSSIDYFLVVLDGKDPRVIFILQDLVAKLPKADVLLALDIIERKRVTLNGD